MKRILTLFLIIALMVMVSLPVTAEPTTQSIPFSGWAQGETGNAWEPNAYIPGIGQVVLCQTADDLTAYLQAGEYPLDYAETYGYDADFFAEKSLLLLEVGAGRPCDLWYVTNLTQIGRVLNCNLLYYEPDGMGPTLIYSRIQCVELNQKPTDIERLRVNVTYDQLSPRDPVSLDFAYGDNAIVYDLGDADGNGAVEAADALLILKSAVGKAELTEAQQAAAQTTDSDEIGAKNALHVLQKVVGKIRYFDAQTTEIAFEQPTPTDDPSYQGYDHMYFAANPDLGAYALVCTTYEEYLAFLDSEKILCHSLDMDKEAFLKNMSAKFPKEYFDGGNSLLLYYLHGTNGDDFASSRYSLVDRTYFANGELVVELRDIYPNYVTYDKVHKLYVCRLMNFTSPIEKIHLQAEVLKYEGIGTEPTKTYMNLFNF